MYVYGLYGLLVPMEHPYKISTMWLCTKISSYERTKVDYLHSFVRSLLFAFIICRYQPIMQARYLHSYLRIRHIADITPPQLPKCDNHLVSFIKVEGLFVPYIVNIFDTIKSRTMV